MFASFRMLSRFLGGLGAFLDAPLSSQDCRAAVADSLRDREAGFLDLMRRAVYGNPRSPYLALLRLAGVEYGDVAGLVSRDGVEATLEKLHEAGVHVRLEEFKGLRPIERPGLTLAVQAEDFDTPLLRRDFLVATSGSTGRRRRLAIDLDLLVLEAAYSKLVEESHGVSESPKAIWQPAPPGSAGLKAALRAAKCGGPLDKWFSPTRVYSGPRSFSSALFTLSAVSFGRFRGSAIPAPEHVPLEEAWRVAQWMAGQNGLGRHAYLSAAASSVVRVCQAALDSGWDLAGCVFRAGGEPYTEGKRRVVASCGARAFSGWSLAECGPVAAGCASPEFPDDMHLLLGKIAIVQRPIQLKAGAGVVDAFHLTTLRRETPKILLNVDSGDYGCLSRRNCRCPLQRLGFGWHVNSVRNYEKLTTGGTHITGEDILELVEVVLPKLHGGDPVSYQFVEQTDEAESRITVVVSRSVPHLDEAALLRDIQTFLAGKSRGQRMMMDLWSQARNMRVVRASPQTTSTGKTPPLLVLPKFEPQRVTRDSQ